MKGSTREPMGREAGEHPRTSGFQLLSPRPRRRGGEGSRWMSAGAAGLRLLWSEAEKWKLRG